MTRPLHEPERERIDALLADRATDGLDAAERAELAALGGADDETFDLAAAALDLATLRVEPMPAELAERVLAATAPAPVLPLVPRPRATRAWLVSAAAVAAAAIAVVWAMRRTPAPHPPPPAAARAELLASAHDATPLPWTATEDPGAGHASGDVVWSPSAQQGYMRIVGLPPNDPARLQYQLWIFDKSRDDKFPVDGGVFDVTSTGEVIIPISAKLHVTAATLFAVTIEQPGGVVVSKREHIVLTAAPTSS